MGLCMQIVGVATCQFRDLGGLLGKRCVCACFFP